MTTLDETKRLMDTLMDNLSALIGEADRNDVRRQQLEDFERQVRELEARVLKQEKASKDEREAIVQEKKFMANYRTQLAVKEEKISNVNDRLAELVDKEKQIKQDQVQLDEARKLAEEKLHELEELNTRKRELDYREVLMKKEMLATSLKKEAIDEQEQELIIEKKRLQHIAEQLGKPPSN
jgi:small-conductance mechanosensitive channel